MLSACGGGGRLHHNKKNICISELGIALKGYVVPGCVEDGTWMLWENSSVVVVGVVVARFCLDKFSKQIVIFSYLTKMTFCIFI